MTRALLQLLVIFSTLTQLVAADSLTEAALAAEARFDSQTALRLFREVEKERPNDPFILQKIARQLSDSVNDTEDRERQESLLAEALSYAERAVQLEPNNAVNVISLAVCHGKLATYADTRQKIAYSRLVKEAAERALALDPNYDWAHHILGRWHYEVASIGSTKRWLANLIYSDLPEASFERAIAELKRAVELSPESVAHTLELGFAFRANGQKAEARAAFQKGLALPNREKHDLFAKARAQTALAELER
jgi:tetratricopeptide (TPR) repeat protein